MRRAVVFALVLAVAFGVVLAGCSGSDSAQPEPEAPAPQNVEPAEPPADEKASTPIPSASAVTSLISDALRTDGSITYQNLVERLGAPRRVEREPVPNQYVADRVDTLRTLVYSGLEALIYDVSERPRSFLVRLALNSDRYATPGGLQVGATRQAAESALGPPTERRGDGTLIYEETGPAPTTMTLTMRDDRVVRIEWTFYVA